MGTLRDFHAEDYKFRALEHHLLQFKSSRDCSLAWNQTKIGWRRICAKPKWKVQPGEKAEKIGWRLMGALYNSHVNSCHRPWGQRKDLKYLLSFAHTSNQSSGTGLDEAGIENNIENHNPSWGRWWGSHHHHFSVFEMHHAVDLITDLQFQSPL